jgi:DNA (cytosine-5)-methyltransferase 1
LLTFATFFCGAGGACVGLEQAGFNVIWGNEYSAPIADIWQANHPQATLDRRDFFDISIKEIPHTDGHWYSFPCPEFSGAKINRTGGTANEDTSFAEKGAEIIKTKNPRWVVIENVPGYAQSKSFLKLLEAFADCGYSVHWAVLDAADYGVPQNRKRLILVASLDGIASLPSPTHSSNQFDQMPLFGDQLLPWLSWHESIADLLPTRPLTTISAPQFAQLKKKNLLVSRIPLLVQLTGYGKKRGPAIKLKHEPMFTITASMSHDHTLNKNGHPSARSPATIIDVPFRILRVDNRCLARWQGFPDPYQWGEIESIKGKAIGNAVPVQLAKIIGQSLLHPTGGSPVADLPLDFWKGRSRGMMIS